MNDRTRDGVALIAAGHMIGALAEQGELPKGIDPEDLKAMLAMAWVMGWQAAENHFRPPERN